ncbi:aminotransferase class IV [Microbacteriaceae bacterium VKM Ac-2855]|nr:aminotransferase class IV [Microbacteriaceae bacterium VKM Ac-2855]
MTSSPVSRWIDGVLTLVEPVEQPLLVADSWLLEDGRALALDAHRDRFLQSVRRRTDIDETEAFAFWTAAIAALPRDGRHFPRLEATDSGLQLRLRPAPPLARSVRLWTSPVDPRRVPETKGPDIPALAILRERAVAAGADEPVLLDAERHVVDGATSAIVWWLGDTLVTPPLTGHERVASVTARTLSVLAGAMGVSVTEYPATPEELDGTEVWSVNALHGIRLATIWLGGPALAAQPGRLDTWRRRLDVLRRPIG